MRAMGMSHVPRTSFVWVGHTVWGSGVWVPYVLVEKYKSDWAAENADALGGVPVGIWESWGDFLWGYSTLISDSTCELSACDDTAPGELADALEAMGYVYDDGFMDSTSAWVDWDRVHGQQAANWLLWMGDDPFHNSNNVVWNARPDGPGFYLPYSADLTAGAAGWYTDTTLEGWNSLSGACMYDTACRDHLFEAARGALDRFRAADPAAIVRSVCGRLDAQGMMRGGDEEECARLEEWYADRADDAEAELADLEASWSGWDGSDTGFSDTGSWDTGFFDTGY